MVDEARKNIRIYVDGFLFLQDKCTVYDMIKVPLIRQSTVLVGVTKKNRDEVANIILSLWPNKDGPVLTTDALNTTTPLEYDIVIV